MKNLPCDICAEACEADSFDQWFGKMLAHWKANHQAKMKAMEETYSQADGAKWMAEHRARFEAL